MRFRKVNILAGFLCFLLGYSNCGAYEKFYYRDKQELESNLIGCLKKWPEILVNYPQSKNPKDADIEVNLVLDYAVNSTSESVLADSNRALSKGDYYGLVMISASIPSDKQGNEIRKAFIDFAKSKLGGDKYKNSILSFCVKTLVSKRFLENDDSVIKERMVSIFDFITKLRSNGFDDKGYNALVGIDNKIIEDCFLELMR